jgi:hypothetical protein
MSPRSLAIPRLAVVVLALAHTPATPATAQDIPTVFQHGVQSDSATWDLMKAPLSSQLRLTPVTKSLPWYESEAFQAQQLIGKLNADPRTSSGMRIPFVAHSNGGLVSRRLNVDQARVANLATIATPHLGTRLANNFLNGSALGYFNGLRAALWEPIDFYAAHDPAWPGWLYTAIEKWNGYWSWVTTNASYWICDVLGMCTAADFANYFAPVVFDVAEGSDALALINSSWNLDREASTISNRVYLYSSIHPRNGFIHLLFPTMRGEWETARSVMTTAYFALGSYYDTHGDPFLASHSYLWIDGALELQLLDANWQQLIGTIDWADSHWSCPPPDENCEFIFSVWANDGVIDHRSAGVSPQLAQLIPFPLAHTEQLKSPDVANIMRTVLNQRFGVPVRTVSPPPLTFSISGPSSVRPGFTCGWSVSGLSGTPPYSYQWYLNGGVFYPSDPTRVEYRNTGSSFSWRLEISDANGRRGAATKTVNVSGNAPLCPF